MGRTKQLLPWPVRAGDRSDDDGLCSSAKPHAAPEHAPRPSTVVSASFDLIVPHCAVMIVVLGHDAPAVAAALTPRRYTAVISDPDAEMLHSVRLGLVEAQRLGEGSPVLLHLADLPAVDPNTVRTIVATGASTDTAVMPEHNGSGGHPAVIPAAQIHGIVTWQGDGGLRAYWQQNPDRTMRLAVDDPAVARDLDKPADYTG